MDAKILAIIPARAGSKRLPGKNVKPLDGRPLIHYSIAAAKATPSITRVAVATDDQRVWEAVTRDPATDLVVGLLPAMTTDTASLTETLKYTLLLAAPAGGFDWVVLLQPTCPLRSPDLLEAWIQRVLAEPRCDGGLAVDRDNFKLGYIDYRGLYLPDYEPMKPKQQVSHNKARENGVFYMFRARAVAKAKPFGHMLPLETPKEQSRANIDTAEDWRYTEWAYKEYGYDHLFERLED